MNINDITKINDILLQMLKIYIDYGVYTCQVINSINDLFSLNIEINDILEYKWNHYKVPVLEYNNKPIIYNDFNDLLFKISNILNINITINDIYDKIIENLYSNDTNNNLIMTLLKEKNIRFHIKEGYQIIHHIIISKNDTLFKYFCSRYGSELKELLTDEYINNNERIVGKQNILHTASIKNKEMYLKYCKYLFFLNLQDNDNKFPNDY